MVFVDDLDSPQLRDGDHHHLERVLRLRIGDALVLGDGRGRWCPASFADVPAATGSVTVTPPSHPQLAIGFALVKSGKPETIVQKLTELGIDRIVPFHAERSVVRWDAERAAKAIARLRTVAREASMQCHRPHLPIVDELTEFSTLAGATGAVLADRGGEPLAQGHHLVLIGPEGGWTRTERQRAVPTVALGGHVLRAETAAIAAGALMAALRSGDLGRLT